MNVAQPSASPFASVSRSKLPPGTMFCPPTVTASAPAPLKVALPVKGGDWLPKPFWLRTCTSIVPAARPSMSTEFAELCGSTDHSPPLRRQLTTYSSPRAGSPQLTVSRARSTSAWR